MTYHCQHSLKVDQLQTSIYLISLVWKTPNWFNIVWWLICCTSISWYQLVWLSTKFKLKFHKNKQYVHHISMIEWCHILWQNKSEVHRYPDCRISWSAPRVYWECHVSVWVPAHRRRTHTLHGGAGVRVLAKISSWKCTWVKNHFIQEIIYAWCTIKHYVV